MAASLLTTTAAGRGALTLGTLRPLPTEPLHIPPLCLGGWWTGAGGVHRRCTWPAWSRSLRTALLRSQKVLGASLPATSPRALSLLPSMPAAGRLPEQNNAVVNLDLSAAQAAVGERAAPPAPSLPPARKGPLCAGRVPRPPQRQLSAVAAGSVGGLFRFISKYHQHSSNIRSGALAERASGRRRDPSTRSHPCFAPPSPPGGGALAEQTAWPEFHNGVAAGLRLAPGAHQLTRTWVVYNKPPGETVRCCGTVALQDGTALAAGPVWGVAPGERGASPCVCAHPAFFPGICCPGCRAQLHACRHAHGAGPDGAPQVGLQSGKGELWNAGTRLAARPAFLTLCMPHPSRTQINRNAFDFSSLILCSCLAATDLYRYLSQEHDATIIGLLLGMAASKRCGACPMAALSWGGVSVSSVCFQ